MTILGAWARRIVCSLLWRAVVGCVALSFVWWMWLLPAYPVERLSYDGLRSTRIFDRNGVLLYEQRGTAGGYARPVALDDVAESVILATLSSEDANFYVHPGIDPIGVVRAVWLNLKEHRVAFGGSTITQQLAKQLDRQPRTLTGKLVEAYDARRLERTLGKREVLTQYLNRVYYGRLAYGIEAAAWAHFGKRARDLSLDEAALLAILPRAPSAYAPDRNPERALRRRAHVLRRMAERGWITGVQAQAAAAMPIRLRSRKIQRRAPHLLDHLSNLRRIPAGAPDVTLAIDIALQEQLERQAQMHLAELAGRGAEQAGIVVLDHHSGEVLAMVGSRGYGEVGVAGAVNVTTSVRPPGSTLKPFVYALAIERGAHPSTLVLDVPTHFLGYQPRAMRERYHGAVAMRDALGSSMNLPAVREVARLGTGPVLRLLHSAGLRSLDRDKPVGLSIALGGTSVSLLELTNAYGTLARGGAYTEVRFMRQSHDPVRERVISEQTAFMITDALADAQARRREFGVETPLDLPFPAAAKTGTSQAFGDNVVVGYSTELTVAVWVGKFDGTPMQGVLAMHGAAPLWRSAMLAAHQQRHPGPFAVPSGVAKRSVCADTGRVAGGVPCARRRLEYVATRTRRSAPEQPPPLAIVGPPDGATFVVDPWIPRRSQRVELRAAVNDARIRRLRWTVDGTEVGETEAPFVAHWTLRPGHHVVRVEGIVEGASEALAFEVAFDVEEDS